MGNRYIDSLVWALRALRTTTTTVRTRTYRIVIMLVCATVVFIISSSAVRKVHGWSVRPLPLQATYTPFPRLRWVIYRSEWGYVTTAPGAEGTAVGGLATGWSHCQRRPANFPVFFSFSSYSSFYRAESRNLAVRCALNPLEEKFH